MMGDMLKNSDFMRKALEYGNMFDKVLIDHCEEATLVKEGNMNEGIVSNELGIKGRPVVAEDIAVARDILCQKPQERQYILLISVQKKQLTWCAGQKLPEFVLRRKRHRSI